VINRDGDKTRFSYAWLILFLLFIGNLASFGMRSSFGAYISSWEQEFSVGRAIVTSMPLIGYALFALGQPIAGKLNDQIGRGIITKVCIIVAGVSLILISQANHIWQIFILYGLVFCASISGCSSAITAAVVTKWFEKKRGLAMGLVMAGLATGQLILVPLNIFLIERFGWRTAMLTLGIAITVIAGSLDMFFLRSKPEEKGLKPYGHEETENGGLDGGIAKQEADKPLTLKSILKVKAFWFLLAPYFVCGFTDVGLIGVHLIPLSEWKGFPLTGVAVAISLIAVCNIVGTVTTGHLSDHFNRKRQLSVIYLLRAGAYVFLILIQQPWLLIPFAIMFGAVEMASIAPTNSLASQFFNGQSTGLVIGVVALTHYIGGSLGSFLPGLVYDLTGSYTITLVLGIVLLLGASATILKFPDLDKKS